MDEIELDENNLYYIEVADHQVTFHYLAFDETIRMPFKDLAQAALKTSCFVQIHQCFIINMRYIYQLDRAHVWMLDDATHHELNISRKYRDSFKKRYDEFLFGD